MMGPEILAGYTSAITFLIALLSLIFLIFALLKKRKKGCILLSGLLIVSLSIYLFQISFWHEIHENDQCGHVYTLTPQGIDVNYDFVAPGPCLHPIDVAMLLIAITNVVLGIAGIITTIKGVKHGKRK